MWQPLKSPPPSIVALLLQCAAFVMTHYALGITELKPSPTAIAWLCGLTAALLSWFSGQEKWWLAIQLFFAPTLVFMLSFEIPPTLSLIAFIILLTIYWSTFRTQVPLYLSSQKVWDTLECLLPTKVVDSKLKFLDLGSGLGGVLTHLARARPDGVYVGVEAAPLPFIWSWLRIQFGDHRNCKVHWGDLWKTDLSMYDVVFAYLSPVPMEQLWRKARTEMHPGSIFISSTFPIPDQPPDKTVQVDDLHHAILHIWYM